MILLLNLSEYRLKPDQTLHWESAEEFDEAQSLHVSMWGKDDLLNYIYIPMGGRFCVTRKLGNPTSDLGQVEGFVGNGVYLDFPSKSTPVYPPQHPWQEWLVKNWELNYWKAYHLIVEFDELRIDAFSSELWFNGKPVDLPKHPHR